MTEPPSATPALEHLMGAYFHQDWMLDDVDEWAVLDRFLAHEPWTGADLAAEIDAVLGELTSEEQVRDYVDSLETDFTATAEDGGYRGWLAEVGRRSRSAASRS